MATLRALELGTAGVTGGSFFRALVKTCSEVLGVECAFVTQCVGDARERVEVIAFWNRGRFEDEGLHYELADTPCQQVIAGQPLRIQRGLQGLYPNDTMLVTLSAESYVGIPLADTAGQILGHLVFLNVGERSSPRGASRGGHCHSGGRRARTNGCGP